METKQGINWSNAIQETHDQIQALKSGGPANIIDNKRIRLVSIASISTDPNQPRKLIDSDSEDIKDLAESIKQHGFINFITVRQQDGGYIVVSGERRLIAAKLAGMDKIPVMVLAEEKEPLDYCLIQLEENLQRKDLIPLDEAEAYERLHKEFGIKLVEISQMVKKNKGYISKMLHVAQIPESIKSDIRQTKNPVTKEVLMLLSVYPEQEQLKLWEKIKAKPTESVLKAATKTKSKQNRKVTFKPEDVFDALKRVLELKGIDCIFEYIPKAKAKKLLKQVNIETKERN